MGTNLIGAVYWAVAARLYGPEAMGRAAALISALMLVATLSQLNLSSTLMRFLPQMGAKSAGRLIKFSYLATSLTALAGSVIFVTVLPRLSSEWDFMGDSAFFAVLFAVSVVVWEIFTLQDAALVGLQRAVAVPIENVIYSLAKLALLVVGAWLLGSTDILFSWMIPLIFLIPVINWLIFRILKDRSPYDAVQGMRIRHLARFASVDYAGSDLRSGHRERPPVAGDIRPRAGSEWQLLRRQLDYVRRGKPGSQFFHRAAGRSCCGT